MRTLIKKILKEETSPDEIRKGIDIAIKVLKKTYPFVVGWEYSDSPDKWAYKIYIDLELDFNKSMEYYGLKPHPIYGKFISNSIEDRERLPYPYSMMNYEEEENFEDLEYRKLQDDLSEIYEEMIPNKFKMKRSGAVFNQDEPKDLGVDNYIFVK